MTRTRWTITIDDGYGVAPNLTLQLDTDDRKVIALVEEAATNAGIDLVRQIDTRTLPEEGT